MALVVKHNSTADGDPLIDGDDWNANHTITGGGTVRIPVLIETKTLSAGTTTTTFSSLNGNNDEEYLIKGEIQYAGTSSGDNWLKLSPNASDSNCKSVGFWVDSGGHGQLTGQDYFYIAGNLSQNNPPVSFITTFNAKSGGVARVMMSNMIVGTTKINMTRTGGIYNDTSTNITSLVVSLGSGSFSGTIKLYKMVDLTI